MIRGKSWRRVLTYREAAATELSVMVPILFLIANMTDNSVFPWS